MTEEPKDAEEVTLVIHQAEESKEDSVILQQQTQNIAVEAVDNDDDTPKFNDDVTEVEEKEEDTQVEVHNTNVKQEYIQGDENKPIFEILVTNTEEVIEDRKEKPIEDGKEVIVEDTEEKVISKETENEKIETAKVTTISEKAIEGTISTSDNYQEKTVIDENTSDEVEARSQQEIKVVAEEYAVEPGVVPTEVFHLAQSNQSMG